MKRFIGFFYIIFLGAGVAEWFRRRAAELKRKECSPSIVETRYMWVRFPPPAYDFKFVK